MVTFVDCKIRPVSTVEAEEDPARSGLVAAGYRRNWVKFSSAAPDSDPDVGAVAFS